MKYLISVTLLLALLGCESQSPESQDSSSGAPSGNVATEEVASGKTMSYLDAPLKAMVNQRGLYRLVRSSGLIDDPSTSTGKAVSKPVIELVKSTERIPLMKGAQLYLQYRLWYLPERPVYIDLRRVLKHPEMKLPDGSVATGSDYNLKQKVSVNQAIGYTGYGLDEDYELVEGDWVFEIWYQGEKMIEQKFTTYWPDEEEIATLTPVLALGNEVMTKVKSPDKSGSKGSWPVVVVGEKEVAESAPLSEMKRAIEDEMNREIDDPDSQEPPQ
jgi:hypothetical protein